MGVEVRTSNNRTEEIFEVIIWVLQKGDCKCSNQADDTGGGKQK